MCTSLLHIHQFSLGMSLDVPCNNCLECRSASQNSWVFRIDKDLEALYKRGGVGVFLTFTYNDACLPHSNFGFDTSKPVPCFSADDITRFLNKVKVFANRNFGKRSYKYFWCSEYGKFTRRPHYHVLFFLEPNVDWYQFCETCRKYWHFGFMFPRNINGVYFDNNLKITTPLLRSVKRACSYVSKYITKDLDFYGLPLIKRYLEVRKTLLPSDRAFYNKFLPRHYQSKGIGSSFLSNINSPDKLYTAIERGVLAPNGRTLMQLPRYYVEKLCFSHKLVSANGVPTVVRTLKMNYINCISKIHRNSLESKANSLSDFFITVNRATLKDAGISDTGIKLVDTFRQCSTEYLVSRYFVARLSPSLRKYFHTLGLNYSFDDVVSFRLLLYFDIPNSSDFYDEDNDIISFFDVFYKVFNPIREQRQIEYHKKVMLQKKYHLATLNLINYV